MATLTFSLTSGVVNGTRNYTLSDADVTRWIAAWKSFSTVRDAQGDVVPNPTNAQVLAAWADDAVARTKRVVKSVEAKAAEPDEIAVT